MISLSHLFENNIKLLFTISYNYINSMYEKIIEIISLVVSELKYKKHINDIDMKELFDLGYTQEEISTAFSWLVDRLDFSEKFFTASTPSPESFRIMLDSEKELFTNEALCI